ncbi:MAG: glycosyltransferase family 87 protein [Bacteroidota bacterium]
MYRRFSTQIDTDFPNNNTAARIVSEGKDVTRLYDDAWFQEQIHAYGMTQQGKFSPFPPVTALAFLPLSHLDPLTALQVTAVVNILLLAAAIAILSSLLSLSLPETTVFVLLSGIGLVNCLRFGQLYIALSLFIIFGYFFYVKKQPVLAGICFGLLVPIKYYPFMFILYFAFRREWRLVVSAVGTMSLVILLGVVVLGPEIHSGYLSSVLGSHLSSHFTQQDPFSPTFQSFDSLLRRLLVFDPVLNPRPLVAANDVFPLLKIIIFIAILAVSGTALLWAHRANDGDAVRFSIGVLGIAGLLLAPGTATYHYVLLWLPVGLVMAVMVERQKTVVAYTFLAMYSAIGFIPYSITKKLDAQGVLTLLAYPRLMLVVGMFVTMIMFIRNSRLPLAVTGKRIERPV